MERIKLTLVILTFLSLTSIIFAQALNRPASIVYDAVNSRYLISNQPTGEILARASDGTLTYFNQGASTSIRGITILGGYLYAAGDEGVLVFNLLTDTYVETFVIADASWLNDICADPNNFLYVTDRDKIFKINSDGGDVTLFFEGTNDATGIVYDLTNNRLLFTEDLEEAGATPAYGRISSLDMAGTTLTPMTDVPGKWLDGIAIDSEDNLYVGSWETGIIYQYPPTLDGIPVELIIDVLGAADFYYNPLTNELAIPLMEDDDVMFYSLDPPVGVEIESLVSKEFALCQNYPNPFNPTTVITYSIPEQSLVSIKIYDVLGNEITTLENGVKNAGTYNLSFDAAGLSTGIYFYTINAGNFVQTKKMLMLK